MIQNSIVKSKMDLKKLVRVVLVQVKILTFQKGKHFRTIGNRINGQRREHHLN